jgi:hypothetical protein
MAASTTPSGYRLHAFSGSFCLRFFASPVPPVPGERKDGIVVRADGP